jgi:hypothetical protein
MCCVCASPVRQSGHRPGRAVDTASTTKTSKESLTLSTRTSIPGNSTASTVLLAMPGHTLPKRSLAHSADLGIHGTADRAEFRDPHQPGTLDDTAPDPCADDGPERGPSHTPAAPTALLTQGLTGRPFLAHPAITLNRWWRARTDTDPPSELQALIDAVATGHRLDLYCRL